MSAILSADDLNDFISPGVACIKPVETLPKQKPRDSDAYVVSREGEIPAEGKPAQISLTDCLACSGCITSAEAVLVSLQSHAEVLNSLDDERDQVFVASVSPQVRASIAATYGVSEKKAGWMIDQLLAGPLGLSSGGRRGRGFDWVVDTNVMREVGLVLGVDEVLQSSDGSNAGRSTGDGTSATATPKKPILSSACPGWICYAEKTYPHVLPHLSRLKSPQALTGTILKTVLSKELGVDPGRIWHLAVMPCFDKKLEASREELTDAYWRSESSQETGPPVRDVDCVITAREVLMLADSRGLSFPALPQQPLLNRAPLPDQKLDEIFYSSQSSSQNPRRHRGKPPREAGTSGGFLHHILQAQLSQNPSLQLTSTRGRNADVIDYTIHSDTPPDAAAVFKAARYYGFRNIQNLVRKLKPPRASRMPGSRSASSLSARKAAPSSSSPLSSSTTSLSNTGTSSGMDYAYMEVMACPGGCTNGGGQIKIDDLPTQQAASVQAGGVANQKEWLQRVDEAYFSLSESDNDDNDSSEQGDTMDIDGFDDEIDGISPSRVRSILDHWISVTGIPVDTLVKTSYRRVESDVGKADGGGGGGGGGGAENSKNDERVAEFAGKAGGGW